MSELLKAQSAKEAWAKGQNLQFNNLESPCGWEDITNGYPLGIFERLHYQFRFKPVTPVTVMLNGVEVPAPFDGTNAINERVWVLDSRQLTRYDWTHISYVSKETLCWRTEEDIVKVVAVLNKAFAT